MLKGAEKRMIVVRTRDSRLFEEAYFVVRPEAGQSEGDALDMLWEANRILESSQAGGADLLRPRSHTSLPPLGMVRGLCWFLAGLLTGGGAVSLLWFLL